VTASQRRGVGARLPKYKQPKRNAGRALTAKRCCCGAAPAAAISPPLRPMAFLRGLGKRVILARARDRIGRRMLREADPSSHMEIS